MLGLIDLFFGFFGQLQVKVRARSFVDDFEVRLLPVRQKAAAVPGPYSRANL